MVCLKKVSRNIVELLVVLGEGGTGCAIVLARVKLVEWVLVS